MRRPTESASWRTADVVLPADAADSRREVRAKDGRALVVGVDVGTGSARAGVFTPDGRLRGVGTEPVSLWRIPPNLAEQSSTQVWSSVSLAVREALAEAGIKDIGIIVGDTKDEIKAAVGDGSRWGVKMSSSSKKPPWAWPMR